MPRVRAKGVPGPSRLSQVLEHLQQEPRPQLVNIRALRLKLAYKNDHFGARHFMKEDLPRIRYHNPSLEIEVSKLPKTKEETWKPELVVDFANGSSQTLDLDKKWSSTILQELLDLAGAPSWTRWKKQREAEGLPVFDPPKPTAKTPKSTVSPLDSFFSSDRPKSGAAAVLP